MPLKLPYSLPAIELLKHENIFIDDKENVLESDTRTLKIVILNLMPLKVDAETDLIRLLSYSPFNIEVELMKLKTHVPKHTPKEHIEAFYKDFDEISQHVCDGLIVTGAPVEQLDFEQVTYWDELTGIFLWAKEHVRSTLYICWAAQAGLYYHYGVPKYELEKKRFGIFPQTVLHPELPLFRGFDDVFSMPHSRHTEIRRQDILNCKYLTLVAESPESGVGMVLARDGKEVFITGHMEYGPHTLHQEYRRDIGKRDDVDMPEHYYREDDVTQQPFVMWRAHGHLLFMNWLNYYVR